MLSHAPSSSYISRQSLPPTTKTSLCDTPTSSTDPPAILHIYILFISFFTVRIWGTDRRIWNLLKTTSMTLYCNNKMPELALRLCRGVFITKPNKQNTLRRLRSQNPNEIHGAFYNFSFYFYDAMASEMGMFWSNSKPGRHGPCHIHGTFSFSVFSSFPIYSSPYVLE